VKIQNVQFHDQPSRRALITGATGRIGRELCFEMAKDGWRLILAGRDQQKLSALKGQVDSVGKGSEILVADLGNSSETASAVRTAMQSGDIDLFIHLASPAPLEANGQGDSEDAEAMMRVNYFAFLEIARALLPGMLARQDGCIVGALSDLVASPARSESHAYIGAKLALSGAISMFADGCANTGIRCIGFAPGHSLTATAIVDTLKKVISNKEVENGAALLLGQDGPRSAVLSPWAKQERKRVESVENGAVASTPPAADPKAIERQAAISRADAQADTTLREIFRRVFVLDDSVDLAGCRWGTVEKWDSLGQLKLLMEVEQAFEVSLPSDFVVKVSSYNELRSYLKTLRRD
jgi:hypothetical protein